MKMNEFQTAALTHPGRKRPKNEDFVIFYEPSDQEVMAHSGSIYILADGVGGASLGEKASQFAAQKILHDYYRYPDLPIPERLRMIIRKAGNEIFNFAEMQEKFMQMATTVVVAVICNNKLWVAHVGDSRAYLVHQEQIDLLTRDHSTVGEMMRDGLLSEEEAMHFNGRNPLSRSLGGQLDVRVDVSEEILIMPGDTVLLASDGLTNYVTRKNIYDFLQQGKPDEVVYRLVDYANQCGGSDNISVIIIHAVGETEKPVAAFKGQKPAPVEWDSMPTLPQNFLYHGNKKRNSGSKSRKKNARIASLVFLGLVIILAFAVFGWPFLSEILSGDQSGTQDGQVETGLTEEVARIEPTMSQVDNPQTESIRENIVPIQEPAEDWEDNDETDQAEDQINPDVTPGDGGGVTPDEVLGWCTYRIDFNNLDRLSGEDSINPEGCKRYTEKNAQGDYENRRELFYLIECEFPHLFDRWVGIEDLRKYAKEINSLSSDFDSDKYHLIADGWELKFPDILQSDCDNAGGVFEPDKDT